MTKDASKYFGLTSLRRSLRHFALGKSGNAFFSVTILFLLARYMPTQEYGLYMSWHALVTILGLLCALGVPAVLQRFLPLLYRDMQHRMVYRGIAIGITIRLLILLMAIAVLWIGLPFLARVLNSETYESELRIYLLAGGLRLTALSLSMALESLLWQKVSQYALAAANGIKLLLILIIIGFDHVNLSTLVMIELACEALMLMILIVWLSRIYICDDRREQGVQSWWWQSRRRIMRYGVGKYAVNLSTLFYGSAANRLLVAALFDLKDVAILGFVDHVMRLIQRFMPGKLLLGLIRPIYMANYHDANDFSRLSRLSNFIFKVNLMVLMVLMVFLLLFGSSIIDLVTAGKYGQGSYLLCGFILVLIFEGLRLTVELQIEAIEQNQISIKANLAQSASLLIALPLLPWLGLWALVISNLIGTVAGIWICLHAFARQQLSFKIDYKPIAQIVSYALFSCLIGWVCLQQGLDQFLVFAIVMLVCSVLFLIATPWSKWEKNMILNLLNHRGESLSDA